MFLKIDFNSDEAIYIQLRNQIIMGIATDMIREGDTLPSVRQMADYIGINMHTVNKAYSVLRQEGFVKLDRRKGAVLSGWIPGWYRISAPIRAQEGLRGPWSTWECRLQNRRWRIREYTWTQIHLRIT